MKQRNIMAVIFFSIFTAGIYDLFWLVSVKKELNEKTKVHTPTLWLLFAPVILLVVVGIVAGLLSSGTHGSSASGANLVSILVGIVAIVAVVPITFYWLFKFSKAVSEYTHGEINTAVAFLLLWLLRFIGLAVIQDKFNDMLAAGTGLAAPADAGFASAPVATTSPMPDQSPSGPVTSEAPAPVAPAPTMPPAPVSQPPAQDENQTPPQPPTDQAL